MIENKAVGADSAVPWHYGNPFAEMRALVKGEALVNLGHFGVIQLTGDERLSWLHLLVTQAVESLVAGESAYALILSAQGHVQHDLKIIDDGNVTWLIVEPGAAPEVVGYLESMLFMYRVAVRDVSSEFAVVGSFARHAVLNSVVEWHSPAAFVDQANLDAYVPVRPCPWPATLAVTPREGMPQCTAGFWAWEALRVAAGVPRVGIDTDHRTLPHEVGLIGAAVHLHKGCYRGQEAVARTINLGRPPRRLVLLHLDGASEELPQPGALVATADGRNIGRCGSVVQHYEDGPLALCLVKRTVALDDVLVVGELPLAARASQTAIVIIE